MLRSEKGKALAAGMPKDRVLTETDGPFARSGKRPLTRADVQVAAIELASLWSVIKAKAEARIRTNLRDLLSRVTGPT